MSVHEMDIDTESPVAPHLDAKTSEQQVLAGIRTALSARKSMVTNKDIILELQVKLETEKDLAKLDLYRSTLERVVHATPDDI
ncbi:biofilm development regulator YmgB/AriR family protein [Phytobacter palmae]|uniref:Biofilm development regulator YmgB/AriR family protein n=1 Tax=Phytobacter palmae TaxID=1855371 RepID=A0ABU9UYZ7_9ENTR